MNFYDRVMLLCKERGITKVDLMNEIGSHVSTMRGWQLGQVPSGDKVLAVAKVFNVSTDYLLGNSNTPDTADAVEEKLGDGDIISLQRARSKMSQKERENMMIMLRAAFAEAFEEDINSIT
jgi:transcriptional regulator with XRE-family HTH domain